MFLNFLCRCLEEILLSYEASIFFKQNSCPNKNLNIKITSLKNDESLIYSSNLGIRAKISFVTKVTHIYSYNYKNDNISVSSNEF